MICARADRLAPWLDGDVTQNEALELEQHVAACSSCQQTHRRLATAARLLQSALPVSEMTEHAAELYGRRVRSGRARSQTSRTWALSLVGACAAIVLAVVAAPREQAGSSVEFTPRGQAIAASDLQRRLGVEVFRHGGEGSGTPLRGGEKLSPDDGLSFVVYNRSGKAWHYMLFGVDAKGEVHWFYPAYTVAGTNPAAPALPPNPEVVALPEGVTADSPAHGRLRVVAMFTPQSVHVEDVEARIAAGELQRLNEMPGAVVQILNLDVFK